MKSLKVIFGMYAVVITLVLANAAMALEDSKPDELKNKKPCPPGQECITERKQIREERRKKILEEKCHGDAACEANMKQKFQEKQAKVKAAMEQCGNDQNCRKETKQKMRHEFREKRLERKDRKQDQVK
jgi:hypothetical protein